MSRAHHLNSCWMAGCFGEASRFAGGARNLRATQENLLLGVLRRNRDCWFGSQHGFRQVRSIDDFRRHVPIAVYDVFRSAIDRIGAGERRVLTSEPVLLLEPTSGSSESEKLIPWTASLQRQFQRAIRTWMYDLFRHRPAARRGRAYWSISPLAQAKRRTAGGVPIGFADDTAYLGAWERRIVRRTLAVPPAVALIPEVRDSRRATLHFLLQAGDLSLISVWSPTFLIELLRHMREDAPRLCDGIERGVLGGGPPNRPRAEFLRSVVRDVDSIGEQVAAIWPRLALISSWADGASAIYADELRAMLPNIELQPKGLLATEAFVSLPLVASGAAALAYRSHFFEFVPVGEDVTASGNTLLADELDEGRQYEVIVTTGGGLYRYRLFDTVEVVGRYGQIPLLRFLGRANATSDLVGEKLTEGQAAAAIVATLADLHIRASFVQLAAVAGPPPRYRLTISAHAVDRDARVAEQLGRCLDEKLQQLPSYRYARELGQLDGVDVLFLEESQAWEIYERVCLAKGQRLGDIKASVLQPMERAR